MFEIYFKITKGTDVLKSERYHHYTVEKTSLSQTRSVSGAKFVPSYNAELNKKIFENFGATTADEILVWYDSKGVRYYVKKSDVEMLAEAPVRAARKEPTQPRKVAFKDTLVKKSQWKLTKDVPLYRDKPGTRYRQEDGAEIFNHLLTGSIITIDDRLTWSRIYNINTALWIHASSGGKKYAIRVEDLNGAVEQHGEPVVEELFLIVNKDTGQFYSGSEYCATGDDTVQYSDKLSKAKKFKRLADVRAHALIMSGYYYDLPESWGAVPDWMCYSKSFDIPRNWVIKKYNKLTKEEIQEIELLDTFDRSWKLRALTIKFGSALRKVYSDLEKKNKLNEFPAVIYFRKPDTAKYWDELSPSDISEVRDSVAHLDKSSLKITESSQAMAVAMKDVSDAIAIRLSYTGELDVGVIDLKQMTEVLEA